MADLVALNTALTALRAARVRIDTASNNVANVATPGYTRQRVELAARRSLPTPLGQLGTGVDVVQIRRIRDLFLDARVRASQDQLAQLSVRAELLDHAERILAEPDQGLTGRLADLWAAFEELALSPTSSAVRTATLSALDDLATRIRSAASGWERLGRNAADALAARVAEVNDLLRALADVNRAIVASPSGLASNDLLDRRDALLDALARSVGATATVRDDGTARVSLTGMSLVDGEAVSPLGLGPGRALVHPSGIELAAGGEVGGFQRFLVEDLPRLQASLDSFVEDLATALNAQHQAGWVSETEQGRPLLIYAAGAPAATVRLAFTDPALLAASSDPGPPFPAFNGENAQALANLRTALVARAGTETLEGSARALAVDLGARVAAALRASDAQRALASAAELARSESHGVFLDEELTLLMEAERAYQATARVMSVVDEALDVLINRTGVVGR